MVCAAHAGCDSRAAPACSCAPPTPLQGARARSSRGAGRLARTVGNDSVLRSRFAASRAKPRRQRLGQGGAITLIAISRMPSRIAPIAFETKGGLFWKRAGARRWSSCCRSCFRGTRPSARRRPRPTCPPAPTRCRLRGACIGARQVSKAAAQHRCAEVSRGRGRCRTDGLRLSEHSRAFGCLRLGPG